MNSRIGLLAGSAALVFVFLVSHSSSRPQVLWRYSYSYFAFLVVYVLIALGAVFWSQSRYRRRLGASFETIEPQAIDRFLAAHQRQLLPLICGLHVILVFLFLPPQRVFSAVPILEVDYAHHYHQVATVVTALSQDTRHWAWDPSFCAGYPLGTLFDVDMKLFEVIAYVLTSIGVNTALAYNCLILMCFLSVPALLFFACRNFDVSRSATVLAVLTGTLIWHSYGPILMLNSVGVCTFVFASYGSLLIVSLVNRVIGGANGRVYIVLLLALSMGLLAHITMPLLLLAPVAALYVQRIGKMPLHRHVLLLGAAIVALAANAWWIATVFRFLPLRVATTFLAPPRPAELIAAFMKFESPGLLLGILGLAGYLIVAASSRSVATMGIAAIASFFFLSNMTLGLPLLSTLEPLRFMIPLVVYSTLGLALGLAATLRSHARPMTFAASRPVLLALGLFAATIWAPRSMFEDGFRSKPDAFKRIVSWIQARSPENSRIAFQDDSPGTLSAARLQFYVDRELIGGPFSEMNLKHAFAAFTRSRFFDKRFAELTREDVRRYADLYNIKSIITSTSEACLAFSRLSPAVRLVDRFSVKTLPSHSVASSSPFERYWSRGGEYPLCFFEVDRQSSFFLQGSGSLAAKLNQIDVVGSSQGGVVIKYHWLEGLATDPVLPIREYRVEGLPIGFIEIDNGSVRDFKIYNAYRPGPPFSDGPPRSRAISGGSCRIASSIALATSRLPSGLT